MAAFHSRFLFPVLSASLAVAMLGAPSHARVMPFDPADRSRDFLSLQDRRPLVQPALDALNAGRLDEAASIAAALISPGTAPDIVAVARDVIGTVLFQKGQPDAAAKEFELSLAANPNQFTAMTKLGLIAFDQGRMQDAESFARKALAIQPLNPIASRLLGSILEEKNDVDAAIAAYEAGAGDTPSTELKVALGSLYNQRGRFADTLRLVGKTPQAGDDWRLLFVTGVAQVGAGQAAAALASLDAARSAQPDDQNIALAQAIAQRRAGRLDEAVANLEKLTASKPDFTAALQELGIAYLARQEPDKARVALEKAAAQKPRESAAQRDLGRAMAMAGDIDGAARLLKEMIARPNATLADVSLFAAVLENNGQFGDAEQAYRDALKRFPGPASSARLASNLALQQKYADARVVISDGLAKTPDDPGLLNMASLVAQREGRMADAIASAKKLAALAPSAPQPLLLLASLTQASGDAAQAAVLYRSLLERAPDHPVALNNLAALLTASGDITEAVALATRARAVAPQNAAVADTLGAALLKANRPADAVVAMKAALELQPDDPERRYRLALAQEAAGQTKEALENVRGALAQPDFPNAAAARALQARLGAKP